MPTIPQWLLGRHLTSVTLIPQTVAADGTLSAGTTKTLTTKTASIEFSSNPDLEDIRPVNNTRKNNVNTGDDSSIDLEIIMTREGLNQLADFVTGSPGEVCQANFTRGGKIWSGFFTRGAFRDGVKNFGKNTSTLTLHQVDDGTGPTYT